MKDTESIQNKKITDRFLLDSYILKAHIILLDMLKMGGFEITEFVFEVISGVQNLLMNLIWTTS